MSVTSFPNGLSSFGFPLLPFATVGRVFFVSSVTGVDANGRGTDPQRPFKTINYAISKCTDNNGDVIFALPTHVESLSVAGSAASPGATGSLSVNVKGVTIIGLGQGSSRATIQWTATAGQFLINQPNFTCINFVLDLATQIDSVVAGVKTVAAETAFRGCRIIQTTDSVTAKSALISFSLAAGWSEFLLEDCNTVISGEGAPDANATGFLAVAAGGGLKIKNCNIDGDFSNAIIDGGTAIVTNVRIEGGLFANRNTGHKPVLKGNNSSTGYVRDARTFVAGAGGAVADVVSGTGWAWLECYGKNVGSGTASGILVPGTASY